MLPRRPGPSSTTRGPPVSRTASPGRTPLVSSYTWMTVFSPTTWMTSPSSCSSPTNWTSYMRGRRPVAVTTGPATRKISPAALPAAAFSFPFIAMLVSAPSGIQSLVQVDPEEVRDDVGRHPRLLPSRDASKVLALPLLPPDVIEDWQDGGRVDVRVVPRLEQVELFDRANELTNPERLQVLQAGGQVLGEGVVPQPGGQCVQVHRNHFGQLVLRNFQAARDERVVRESRLRGPEPEQGLEIHNIDLAADELSHQAGAFRPLRHDEQQVLIIELG